MQLGYSFGSVHFQSCNQQKVPALSRQQNHSGKKTLEHCQTGSTNSFCNDKSRMHELSWTAITSTCPQTQHASYKCLHAWWTFTVLQVFVYVAFDVKLSLGYLYILKHLSYFIAMKTYWKEVFCAPLVKIFRIHFFESFLPLAPSQLQLQSCQANAILFLTIPCSYT